MALKAVVEVALFLAKQCKEDDGLVEEDSEEDWVDKFVATIFLGSSAVFVVGVLVTIAVGMLRVFFAYQCEDNVWNLFTGCVEL